MNVMFGFLRYKLFLKKIFYYFLVGAALFIGGCAAYFSSVLGIIGVIGLVFFCEMIDASIRKPEELERMSSIPVLASILDYRIFPSQSKNMQYRQGKTHSSVSV